MDIKTIAQPKYIIPEYSINLLDKNKKIINVVENVNLILSLADVPVDKKLKNKKKEKNNPKTSLEKKKKIDPKKNKKKITKTLWVRRKKKAA